MPLPFESGRKMITMPKRIPEETKRRAIQFVRDDLDEYPNLTAAVRDGLATARGRG
jgi:hypothetical protein